MHRAGKPIVGLQPAEGSGFRGSGVQGFRGSGFRLGVEGFGIGVQGFTAHAWQGLGLRVHEMGVWDSLVQGLFWIGFLHFLDVFEGPGLIRSWYSGSWILDF